MTLESSGSDVSVVIATRNAAEFLPTCLSSVLGQSEPPAEILVVDGGSTDGTTDVAQCSPLVRVIQQSGTGLPSAWNEGIREARGAFIAMIDADDTWDHNHLRRCRRALEADPTALCALAKVRFTVPGGSVPVGLRPELAGAERIGYMPGATMFRRTIFDRVGLFPEEFVIASDIDWFGRLRDPDIHCLTVDEVGLIKRMHGGNLSLDPAYARTYARELLTIARQRASRVRKAAAEGDQPHAVD